MREQAGQNPARAGEALSIRSARAGTWTNTGVADATDVLALEIARLEALWVDHPLRPQLRLAHHSVPPVRKEGLQGPTNGQEDSWGFSRDSPRRVVEFPAKIAGKASRLLGKPAGNFGAGSTLQLETSRNLSKLGPLKQQPFCL